MIETTDLQLKDTIKTLINEFDYSYDHPEETNDEMYSSHEFGGYIMSHLVEMVQQGWWEKRLRDQLERLYSGTVFSPSQCDIKMLLAIIGTKMGVDPEIILTHV